VVAAAGYPGAVERGAAITGCDEAEAAGALVFHAGTARRGDRLVANGGRVVAVTGVGTSLADARDAAYAGVARVEFDGAWSRSDVALEAAGERMFTLRG
jgi:phosphoribosylamine--glycine ligase